MKASDSMIILLIVAIGPAGAASASSLGTLYSTTDLGPGYTPESNAGGQDYGVANSSGSVVYAFDKLPVTSVDIVSQNTGSAYDDSVNVATMEIGNFKVGLGYDRSAATGQDLSYPSFMGITQGWDLNGGVPVSDINRQGQVVGRSELGGGEPSTTYAAFSAINAQSHNGESSIVNNLNTYIASIPGVTLTSAMTIDDLGRIIAVGSDGNDYLLTPTALGAPETVPEPTALALLAVASAGVTIRRRLRR